MTPLEKIAVIATRDYHKQLREGDFGPEWIPSVGALAWAWDFFSAIDEWPDGCHGATGPNHSLGFTWRNGRIFVVLCVGCDPWDEDSTPNILCRKDGVSTFRSTWDAPKPTMLMEELGRYGFKKGKDNDNHCRD